MTKAFVDASPKTACVVFEDGTRQRCEMVDLPGTSTSNQAEYKAVIYALIKAGELGIVLDEIFSDSQLIVRQLNREYAIRNKILLRFAQEIWKFVEGKNVRFTWIPREVNEAGRVLG